VAVKDDEGGSEKNKGVYMFWAAGRPSGDLRYYGVLPKSWSLLSTPTYKCVY
jgi:hypothetical protein